MGKLQGKLTRVDIHFPASMVNSINEAVTSLAKSRDVSFRFSKQDTLIALLARTLTRMDPENTFQYILNFFMVSLFRTGRVFDCFDFKIITVVLAAHP